MHAIALAAQPDAQVDDELYDIELIALGAPMVAFNRNTGQINNVAVDASGPKRAADPERALPGLSSRQSVHLSVMTTFPCGSQSGPTPPAGVPQPATVQRCGRPALRAARRETRLSNWLPPVPATLPVPVRNTTRVCLIGEHYVLLWANLRMLILGVSLVSVLGDAAFRKLLLLEWSA
ncbi:hypothetical protein [Paraburkholderia tropica]|uniref:hypothetical protein n=1 Tax=Paraburkholderia tropica TaxID=92647 RepID=UPI001F22CB2D|nr:hypothetical protein [Paraburkholderia tropica]